MIDSSFEKKLNAISDGLIETGLSVVRDFFSEIEIGAMTADLLQMRIQNRFRPAGIGRGQNFQIDETLRRDEICWLEKPQPNDISQQPWSSLEVLKTHLNRSLFLGLNDFDSHYAIYPPGGFYRRHLDRFTDDDRRVVSVVAYLNRDWRPEFGGQLKLYPSQQAILTVEPNAGTLVCFLSAQIEHEVVPSNRERMSLAAWMKRRG
jgi:SM-20-related protein